MNNDSIFDLICFYEKNLVQEFIIEITHQNPTNENFTKEDLMKYNLTRKDSFNASTLAHYFLFQNIIDFIFINFFKKENTFYIVYNFSFLPKETINLDFLLKINQNDLLSLLEKFHIYFLNSEFTYKNKTLERIKSKIHLKETGSVYTQEYIAKEISLQTIQNCLQAGDKIENLNILDFGCGTGRFYYSVFKLLENNFSIPKNDIINNLYAIDSNIIALCVLKLKILFEVGINYIPVLNKNIIHRNMLIAKQDLAFENTIHFDLNSDFVEVMNKGGFDCIVSNPPYFLLKINKNKISNKINIKNSAYLAEKINTEVLYFRNSTIYHYSLEGMLNYYKLSIEMMVRLAKPRGEIGVICPSTLFGDSSSKKLRKFILKKNRLRKVEFFDENRKLFDNVSQATAIFYLSKGEKTKNVELKTIHSEFSISRNLIESTFPTNLEIPQMEEMGWNILKKLNKFKKLKDFKTIRNRRGELDLLNFRNVITKENTNFRLIRGNMISQNKLDYTKQEEFVIIEEFKKAKSKDFLENDFQKIRLVCQQISNTGIDKRLKFAVCSEKDILANSCNYIAIDDNKDLKNLQILLNSYILNWRFKITSTNNHINNYELDELPLIDCTKLSDLENTNNELKNNIEIAKLYNLNSEEIIYILKPFFSQIEIQNYL